MTERSPPPSSNRTRLTTVPTRWSMRKRKRQFCHETSPRSTRKLAPMGCEMPIDVVPGTRFFSYLLIVHRPIRYRNNLRIDHLQDLLGHHIHLQGQAVDGTAPAVIKTMLLRATAEADPLRLLL